MTTRTRAMVLIALDSVQICVGVYVLRAAGITGENGLYGAIGALSLWWGVRDLPKHWGRLK